MRRVRQLCAQSARLRRGRHPGSCSGGGWCLTQVAFSPSSTSGLEGPDVPVGHAFISEMFSGIQGEGPYVGVRQVFVRLAGCDLRCHWCDTPASLVRRGAGRYETSPGSREFTERPNPVHLPGRPISKERNRERPLSRTCPCRSARCRRSRCR